MTKLTNSSAGYVRKFHEGETYLVSVWISTDNPSLPAITYTFNERRLPNMTDKAIQDQNERVIARAKALVEAQGMKARTIDIEDWSFYCVAVDGLIYPFPKRG